VFHLRIIRGVALSTESERCNKGESRDQRKKAMETAAHMEKWKNERHVFPLSHKRGVESEGPGLERTPPRTDKI
jgi:hypothetical protein